MIVDFDHGIGNETDISASVVLDEVCPKKQKTGEELGNKIGYIVGKHDHKVGVSDEVELEARPDEVGPEKLKTREGLCNEIGFEDKNMDIGLAVSTVMNTGVAILNQKKLGLGCAKLELSLTN